MANSNRILFTVGQVAERLGFGKAKINALIEAGHFEVVNTATRTTDPPELRITKRSINAWLKGRVVTSFAQPPTYRQRIRPRARRGPKERII